MQRRSGNSRITFSREDSRALMYLCWPSSGTFQVERRVFRCFLGGSPALARNDVGGVPPPTSDASERSSSYRAVVLLCFFQKVSQRRDV